MLCGSKSALTARSDDWVGGEDRADVVVRKAAGVAREDVVNVRGV